MIYKKRTRSYEHSVLVILRIRKALSKKGFWRLRNLEKGYAGELAFDARVLARLKVDCLILNDLLLRVDGTLFQIDTLIIFSGAIYVYDVKNYEGDYYFKDNALYKKPKNKIFDPAYQLERCRFYLNSLLEQLGIRDCPLNTAVVFINPDFTLYQAPMDKPLIFNSQLNRLISGLNEIPSAITEKHLQLAKKLKSLHIENFPYQKLPEYNFDQMKKGPYCVECGSFNMHIEGHCCTCKKCGHVEKVVDMVIRMVEEIRLLFPDLKITINIIKEWICIIQKQRLQRIISKHYRKKGERRGTYYE